MNPGGLGMIDPAKGFTAANLTVSPADSDDAATLFRTDGAGDFDLIPPVLGRSVGGFSLDVFELVGQADSLMTSEVPSQITGPCKTCKRSA